MNIKIPNLSLVVLVGASGSGKSTFARTHFKSTEVISSDFCRGLVSDDENNQAATRDAFDVLHYIASKRLAAGNLTVVDATNVQAESRKPLIDLAREYHCLPVAIVLDVHEAVCQQRNSSRSDRDFGPHVVHGHVRLLRQSLRNLKREGFRHIFVLQSADDINATTIVREPLYNDKKHESGPFDIIGDVHGCYEELVMLLDKLGYVESEAAYIPPNGRKAVFLGDLVDRGPNSPGVLRLVMSMVANGSALCVPGNHDMKLLRKLQGRDVEVKHGLATTLEQLANEPSHFTHDVERFLDGLVSHYVLDSGQLVVAHAGMRQTMQGRGSRKVRDFALYGETTGETDEFGLPVRYLWAEDYRGTANVVYGHTPVPEPEWLNGTINIDTGCVFGGKLTALRYPEREVVSIPALRVYAEPIRPFLTEVGGPPGLTAQQVIDDVIDIEDVIGKRLITTGLHGNITIREENSSAALEVMSRFSANRKWLIYLPPTMSPPETSREEGLLEHPAEAFTYFRNQGVETVICEEKHMGSRAVVIVCRTVETAQRRFGITEDGIGIVYTRTGRRFFTDKSLEQQLLNIIVSAFDRSNLWDELQTDWACLDCELMPWSAKAQELLKQQFASIGAAAAGSLQVSVTALQTASAHYPDAAVLLEKYQRRQDSNTKFVEAYRRYCWDMNSLTDLRLAPFHILATESAVHVRRDHQWHMDTIAKMCAEDDTRVLLATNCRLVSVNDEASVGEGIGWWEDLTSNGGEGMVVKPLDFVSRGARGLVQPAIKCRGREYLRIIYGSDYTAVENIDRLRRRNVAGKRSLALREFALGVEGLERFVRYEPLRKVHECSFAVLALESEPIDPRL